MNHGTAYAPQATSPNPAASGFSGRRRRRRRRRRFSPDIALILPGAVAGPRLQRFPSPDPVASVGNAGPDSILLEQRRPSRRRRPPRRLSSPAGTPRSSPAGAARRSRIRRSPHSARGRRPVGPRPHDVMVPYSPWHSGGRSGGLIWPWTGRAHRAEATRAKSCMAS